MEKEVLISIIIPVYNADTYLTACLDSVVNQTYQNLEIILINDGSTDGSLDVCERYAENDTRIILINQKNAGVAAARNRGLKAATGDYVMFVDADDILTPYICEAACNNVRDYDVLIFGFENFENTTDVEQKKHHIKTEAADVCQYTSEEWVNLLLHANRTVLTKQNLAAVWGKLYKREFLETHQIGCPAGISIGEDMLMNLQVFLHQPKVCDLSTVGYFYRYNPISAVHRYNPQFLESDRRFYKELRAILDEKNLWEPFRDGIGYQQLNSLLLAFSNDIFHRDNPKTEREKKAEYLELISREEYQRLFTVQLKNFDLVKRCALILAKNKWYYPLKAMYAMKDRMRKIK